MLEKGGPRYALPLYARREDREREREREREHPEPTWISNGKCQSDRSQVIGGKLLIGQLAPWVTWDI